MELSARFDLSGRVALVTGSSRGIGRALALGLAGCGADVAIHCATGLDEARRVAAAIAERGPRSCALRADLAEEGAPTRLADEVTTRLGPPAILVLNAAVEIRRPWAEIEREEFDRQVTVNLRASLELLQRVVPSMAERGWGRVLNIGSVQQVRPHPRLLLYAALKNASAGLVHNLARQLAPSGVTVNTLAPGAIETDRNAAVLADPDYRRQALAKIPAGRFGQPDDCVGAALLLCSDAGRYITGVDLLVDGGMHLG